MDLKNRVSFFIPFPARRIMSTEHENPTVATPQPETIVISCSVCHETMMDNDCQVSCTCEHCGQLMCAKCMERLIQMVFSQPTLSYPFRCGSCSQLVDQHAFDGLIAKREDYGKFIACVLPLFWSTACLQDHEQLVSCKHARSRKKTNTDH